MSIPNCRIFACAHDTELIISDSNWDDTIGFAEYALTLAMGWLNNNLLTLNVRKTQFITLATRRSAHPAQGSIDIRAHTCTGESSVYNCPSLTKTNYVKYLGVFLYESFNWYD